MKIYAKSALVKEQLDCKMNIGCDGIEIQLLTELINGRLGRYFMAENVFDLEQFRDYPVCVVHAPLLSHYGLSDVTIECFVDSDFMLLDQVFYIANYFGEIQNKKVIVVLHSETDKQNMSFISDTWRKAVNAVGCLLFKYPYTELGIENVSPLRRVGSGDIHLCSNFHFDNIDMAVELRKQLHTDRVGTVLDTCHAMLTEKYLTAIYKELAELPCEDYSIDTYFAKNKDIIKLIHMSDIKGCGYGAGRHGIRFDASNKSKLKELMGYYMKYNLTCPITLEVGEENLLVSDGYASSRKTILDVIDEMELS